jgi:hypothetical protein
MDLAEAGADQVPVRLLGLQVQLDLIDEDLLQARSRWSSASS